MKSFKELLHRKTEEPSEPELEQPKINLKDVAELEVATEQQIITAIKTEKRLRERRESLSRYMRKMEMKPLEVVEEKIVRKQKLNRILALITQEISAREKRKISAKFQKDKDWNKETVQRLIRDRQIRWTTQDVNLLKRGLITIDVMQWNVATSQIITIGNVKFDLEKVYPPLWQRAIQNKFKPIFLPISGTRTGATRYGKPMKRWRGGDESFEEAHKIKLVSPTMLAIMVV